MRFALRPARDIKFPPVVWHVFAWGLYILYEVGFLYLMTGTMANPASYVLNYAMNISLFYFNAHVLIHYASEKWRLPWLIIIVLMLIQVVIFVALKYPVNVMILGDHLILKTRAEFQSYLASNTIRSIYYVGLSIAYWFARMIIRSNKRISILENQKLIQQNEKIRLQKDLLQSRNAYLQAQVNPHLLFNTLNFMYNASAKVSDKLADAVMTLSDIMRYALTSIDDDDKTPLHQELGHIRNFIHLNQIRFDDGLNVDFQVKGDPAELRIIPLALITLVENVFKYGDLQDKSQPAKILVTIEDASLKMVIFNRKRANQRAHGHGTGVSNLRERLELHYPGAYELIIYDKEETYELTLTLNLNNA